MRSSPFIVEVGLLKWYNIRVKCRKDYRRRKHMNRKIKTILPLLLALLITLSVIPVSVNAAGDYPYPELLDYTALDESFEALAKDKILPEFQTYILNAVKYHIESETDDYRVARNLLQLNENSVDGNVIFFFDGCSTNLVDVEYTASGYKKADGMRYNTSAVCLVVRLNEAKQPVIEFASSNVSTMADNVRDQSLNNGNPISITRDGIYNINVVNHQSKYASLQIATYEGTGVRCSEKGTSYISYGTGINLHSRGYRYPNVNSSTRSSVGCFNIGYVYGDAEYNDFIKAATGLDNAIKSKFDQKETSYGLKYGSCAGITIVDRSNYKEQLKVIYGDDKSENGWTAEKIVSEITVGSEKWHEEILEYTPKAVGAPLSRDIVILLCGTKSTSAKEFDSMKSAVSEFAENVMSDDGLTGIAVMSYGDESILYKASEEADSFCTSSEDVAAALENAETPGGNSYITDALISARELLADSKASRKIIVLMADNTTNKNSDEAAAYGIEGKYDNECLNTAFNAATETVEKYGCTIYTMGFGVSEKSERAEFLSDTAELKKGSCISVNSTSALGRGFNQLAEEILLSCNHIIVNISGNVSISISDGEETLDSENAEVSFGRIIASEDGSAKKLILSADKVYTLGMEASEDCTITLSLKYPGKSAIEVSFTDVELAAGVKASINTEVTEPINIVLEDGSIIECDKAEETTSTEE